jgi:hypothetical protein
VNITITCPSCRRSTDRYFVGLVCTTVHDMTCRSCGDKRTYIVEHDPYRNDVRVYIAKREVFAT